MKKIGIFVGEEMWTFFREIYSDLNARYQIEVYREKIYNTPLLYGRLNRWAFNSQMRSMLRRNDVCFFEWASNLLMHASKMPKQCAVVTRLHSFELYEWAPQINWNAVDKIILISHAMQRQFAALYPEQAHKTVVVYNGRSLNAFYPPAKKTFNFQLGMLCHLKPIKRIYETILMLYELRQKGYRATLSIAGEASSARDLRYKAALTRLVKELNLSNAVNFNGYVNNVSGWLQNIDIFISNSFWEGQQVALLEAMASGCYCLSHFWAGAEEMLPPENLYITEADLQQKIITYANLSETEKAAQHAHLRNLAVKNFDIERTKAGIRQVIEQVNK